MVFFAELSHLQNKIPKDHASVKFAVRAEQSDVFFAPLSVVRAGWHRLLSYLGRAPLVLAPMLITNGNPRKSALASRDLRMENS